MRDTPTMCGQEEGDGACVQGRAIPSVATRTGSLTVLLSMSS